MGPEQNQGIIVSSVIMQTESVDFTFEMHNTFLNVTFTLFNLSSWKNRTTCSRLFSLPKASFDPLPLRIPVQCLNHHTTNAYLLMRVKNKHFPLHCTRNTFLNIVSRNMRILFILQPLKSTNTKHAWPSIMSMLATLD